MSVDVSMNFVRGEIGDLLALEEGLTPWEVDFIESISQRLENGPLPLTEKQITKIHELWDRHCG